MSNTQDLLGIFCPLQTNAFQFCKFLPEVIFRWYAYGQSLPCECQLHLAFTQGKTLITSSDHQCNKLRFYELIF